jgi:hypothetical protein
LELKYNLKQTIFYYIHLWNDSDFYNLFKKSTVESYELCDEKERGFSDKDDFLFSYLPFSKLKLPAEQKLFQKKSIKLVENIYTKKRNM